MPPSDAERLATLEERMSAIARTVGGLHEEIGSSRDPLSIRGRLHVIENDHAARTYAAKALEAFQRAQETQQEAKAAAESGRRLELRDWITTLVAVASLVVAVVVALHG